jgi:hypothetical protein
VLAIANVLTRIVLKQDNDDTDWEICDNGCESSRESTLVSDIEEDNVDKWHDDFDKDQVGHYKPLGTRRALQQRKRSNTDTAVAHTLLSNLGHLAGAITPALLKCEKSTINIFCQSDVVRAHALPLPKSGGEHTVPHHKASGDHSIPPHHGATFEIVKQFMEAIILTNTPWPNISDEKYWSVGKALKLAIEVQDGQQALVGASVGTPSVCKLPGGPSLNIDLQAKDSGSV